VCRLALGWVPSPLNTSCRYSSSCSSTCPPLPSSLLPCFCSPCTLPLPLPPPPPQLSTKFSNHVLDATKAYKRLVTDKGEVEGLPATALGLAAQQAKGAGHEGATAEEGPWLFSLDFPSY